MRSTSAGNKLAAEISERLVLLVEHSLTESALCREAILTQSHLYGVAVARTGGEPLAWSLGQAPR